MGDVSRSSITLSSASYASSLFPAVDEASAALIEAILSRVSPSESEWKPFLQAYDEVFNERGLDKQSDTVIYDLILKLGLQSGKNWRAKWENVKRTQQEVLLQRESAHQRVDQGATRNDNNDVRTPINKTGKSYTRDDILPGYENHGQPRLTREALDKLQHAASPYKAVQTPFAGQPRLNNREGTTPRVHFAQDNHVQHSRAHSDVFRTPDFSTPSHTAEEREAMLRQAIQMDRMNLLGRMYDDWISRLFVLKRLDMHTALARDALLKRRSLTFWHERVHRHRDLEGRVDMTYEATLKRSCLRLWHQKKETKQKTEWERQITLAYRSITRKKERQVIEAAFTAWREASLDSRSSRFRRTCLLRNSLEKWLANAARLAELHSEATALQASHDDILLVNTFSRWKTNTILLVRESEVVEGVELRLLSNAFQSWRMQLEHIRTADKFASSITQKSAFSIWRRRKERNDLLVSQALSLSQARDEDTVERAFHTWKIREHSRLLERAKKLRLARAAFQTWMEQYRTVTRNLECQAATVQRLNDSRLIKNAFTTWGRKTRQYHKTLRLASRLRTRLLTQRIFADWKDQLSKRKMEFCKAEVAHAFFCQRNAMRIWSRKMRWMKANKLLAGKESSIIRDYFHSWHEKTRRAQRFAILEEGISAAIDQRIMSDALSTWTNRVIELRARAISVKQTREQKILHSTFSHWINKSRQNIENLSLVDSFIEVQEEDLIRNKFKTWLFNTKRKIRLRELLEDKLKEDEKNLVAGIFDRWIDVYKERQLIDQEMDIVRYRTYQSLGTTLQKWKSRTMTLPAIRFDAQRQRRRFFAIWKERLPERIEENHAIEHDKLRLLRATLTVWQEGTRAKAARRAANRFRAFAARSPLPSSSSSYSSRYLLPPTPVSNGRTQYPASVPRLRIVDSSSSPISTSTSNRQASRLGSNLAYTPTERRESTITTSTSMPLIYSVSRLRKEVGSSSPLRRKMMENTEIAQSSSPRVNSATATEEGSPQIQSAPAVGQVKSRRGSTLNPESIELPPSSSATGPSSSSSSSANSSPMARQSSLPQTFPSLNYDINEKNVGNDKQSKIDLKEESSSRRHDRNKSRSRDKAFEEGILKEMRERLAAAGLGG